MLSPLSSNNDDNDQNIIDKLYHLCKENEIEKVRSILPFLGNINIINKIQISTGSTCLHVACYYGHRDMVQILLEYGALHSTKNLRHNLTPYEEACTDDIKQLFVEQRTLFSNNDYDNIEWSMVGDDLLEKRREFRQAIDVYKTYDNHHLVSKLLAEVIHYYLNDYLINQSNDTGNSEHQITREQIETIEAYFKEAIEKQDYLTYFIKAYTLTNFFYKVLNKHLALYILEYFDKTKTFSSNYRLVNCLIHLITLLIYHPNLPQHRYQGLCYRGMRITQNDLDQYQLNQHILNRSFLSTSIDRQVAEMFAGEGEQSQMRHTLGDHCALQYSCLCQYLIKQNSTAINIQNLSTRSDEKEILIIPFSVFKVMTIKRNYLDDPTASISIEIELEECEDPNDNKKESESSEISRSTFSSSSDVIKDVEEYVNFKQRKRLYCVIGVLLSAIILALSFIFIYIFIIKKKTTNMATPTPEKDNDGEYQLTLGCPKILNRSSWDARPYISRENLTTLPVTHIVIRQLPVLNSTMNQQDCIKTMKDLQDSQMDKRGWTDIGYNFLICNDNNDQQKIYRGRGWTYVGAHCVGYNFKSLGKNQFLF
ncbi:unnamed protein product [Didymodactylos carnosus]|uniref:Peptidoglycan recognition protein family domain-containing protein n=2 Tax=Didymodactylos carnosus TaxID=1234261 RepID=A0A814SUJ0_9BILA|nr:unnamed protein product [Didymodactylos carnosus]CAF3914720.1 unnamed protein product [Didymodactylos carnosus]